MSDYMADLAKLGGISNGPPESALTKKDRSTLDLNDYLQLMVAMFQNQTIDNTADISDMMNNMVQMSVVEAISSISSLIEESTALNYAASLVGKQVTVGVVNNGQLIEIEGYVAATGTYNGQQVIFLKDKNGDPIDGYVPISSIMAIGWLSETAGGTIEPEEPEGPEGPGEIEDPEAPGAGEDPDDPGEDEGLGETDETGENEKLAGADGYGMPRGSAVTGGTNETEKSAGVSAVSGADGYGEPMR